MIGVKNLGGMHRQKIMRPRVFVDVSDMLGRSL